MEWISAAIVLIFLLWRFPKITLKIAGTITAIAAISGLGAWAYWYVDNAAYEFEKNKITISVMTGDKNCSDQLPLRVRIQNGTKYSLDEIGYVVSAKIPGRSSEVYSSYESSDLIIPAARAMVACVGLSQYNAPDGKVQGLSAPDLEWSARISSFKKSP